MSRNRRRAALHRFPLMLTGLTAILCLPPVVFGQPPDVAHTPKIIEIIILNNNVAPVNDVDLRPNTPTEFGFDVKNRAGFVLGEVTLKLVQVVNGEPRVIAETNIPKLEQTPEKKDGFQVRKFDKDPVKLDGDKGDKNKAAPKKLALLGSPPFKLQVHIHHKNLKVPIIRDFNLTVREPKDYVEPTADFDPATGLLKVDVSAKSASTFLGPHLVPLKLELSPEVTAKAGKRGAKITDLTKVTVDVGEFTFERKLGEGDVYLKVDGYERAFTYRVKPNIKGAINPRDASEIRVRIGVPRYAPPDGDFKVPLEIDGPLTGDYKVQVGMDQDETKTKDGLREQKVSLGVSPEGKLICEAIVRDWEVTFNTSDIVSGNVKFRVSVLKDGRKVELTVPPESRPLMAKTEPDNRTKEIISVFALVTVDKSEPEGIKLELPKDKIWGVEAPLELRARAKERKPTQAPISRAILTRAPKDDKQAPEILAEGEFDPKQNDWKFTLTPQKPETLQFSVQFMTATGAKAALNETITFKAGVVTKKLYTIKGRVLESGRPQPDLDVLLFDPKAKEEKGKAKTSAKGEFVFENVEPGSYTVSSREDFKKRTATTTVVVPAKDNKEINVTLALELPNGK